jgi:hypothetical protein
VSDESERRLDGPIEVGDAFVWEPDKPHAFAYVVVTAIREVEGDRWVETVGVSGTHWNEESRFRQACVRPAADLAAPIWSRMRQDMEVLAERDVEVRGIPLWLTLTYRDVHDWVKVGDGRYRGVVPARDCCALVAARGRNYLRRDVPAEAIDRAMVDVVARTFEKMEHGLAELDLPACAKPGCTERGRYHFRAADVGHLGWHPGVDPDTDIRLCPQHGVEVYESPEFAHLRLSDEVRAGRGTM